MTLQSDVVVKRPVWSIGLLQGPSLSQLSPPEGVVNPIITAQDIIGPKGAIAADPFALQVDGRWFVFFELMTTSSPHAVIAAASSVDLVNWTSLGVVLEQSHHLSYPFVFEHEGEIFMMPESKKARQVTIYRAEAFPYRWKKVKTLLHGRYCDASMVCFEKRYWLFVGWQSYSLCVFYASHPLGPWKRHAWPFVRLYSKGSARPGGRPLLIDGKLIRFGQDNRQNYGHSLRAWEVTTLTPTWFSEKLLCEETMLSASGQGWNALGMHHIDIHQRGPQDFLAFVDGIG